jgi:hypothetical protein
MLPNIAQYGIVNVGNLAKSKSLGEVLMLKLTLAGASQATEISSCRLNEHFELVGFHSARLYEFREDPNKPTTMMVWLDDESVDRGRALKLARIIYAYLLVNDHANDCTVKFSLNGRTVWKFSEKDLTKKEDSM